VLKNNTQTKFVLTRQHQRFAQFSDACRANRYIGICTGRSGVGKTSSAEAYSRWSVIEPLLEPQLRPKLPPAEIHSCHTVVYTPDIACTVKRVESGVSRLRNRFDTIVQESFLWYRAAEWHRTQPRKFVELMIVDEAQRLNTKCLESIRDFSKSQNIGVVLLARPGFEFRVRDLEHIGNHVAFNHVYNTPRTDELKSIWHARSQCSDLLIEDEAVEMIEKVTSSNIQKVVNIQAEINRVCKINSVSLITPELVQEASKTLLYDPR